MSTQSRKNSAFIQFKLEEKDFDRFQKVFAEKFMNVEGKGAKLVH